MESPECRGLWDAIEDAERRAVADFLPGPPAVTESRLSGVAPDWPAEPPPRVVPRRRRVPPLNPGAG